MVFSKLAQIYFSKLGIKVAVHLDHGLVFLLSYNQILAVLPPSIPVLEFSSAHHAPLYGLTRVFPFSNLECPGSDSQLCVEQNSRFQSRCLGQCSGFMISAFPLRCVFKPELWLLQMGALLLMARAGAAARSFVLPLGRP